MHKFIHPLTSEWEALIERPTASFDDLKDLVLEVFKQVQNRGDEAVLEYTKQFDKIQLQTLQVSPEEILNGVNAVPKELKKAIQIAKSNIEAFHKAQKTKTVKVEIQSGVNCWQEKHPIEKVGKELRAMMPWIGKNKLVDKDKN